MYKYMLDDNIIFQTNDLQEYIDYLDNNALTKTVLYELLFKQEHTLEIYHVNYIQNQTS